MEGLEDDITIVKSLIAICKEGYMMLNKLPREFREMEGRHLDYRKYGYRSLESMLRASPHLSLSQVPDGVICRVNDSKMSHVTSLVQRTKKKPSKPKKKKSLKGRSWNLHQGSSYSRQSGQRRPSYPTQSSNFVQSRTFSSPVSNSRLGSVIYRSGPSGYSRTTCSKGQSSTTYRDGQSRFGTSGERSYAVGERSSSTRNDEQSRYQTGGDRSHLGKQSRSTRNDEQSRYRTGGERSSARGEQPRSTGNEGQSRYQTGGERSCAGGEQSRSTRNEEQSRYHTGGARSYAGGEQSRYTRNDEQSRYHTGGARSYAGGEQSRSTRHEEQSKCQTGPGGGKPIKSIIVYSNVMSSTSNQLPSSKIQRTASPVSKESVSSDSSWSSDSELEICHEKLVTKNSGSSWSSEEIKPSKQKLSKYTSVKSLPSKKFIEESGSSGWTSDSDVDIERNVDSCSSNLVRQVSGTRVSVSEVSSSCIGKQATSYGKKRSESNYKSILNGKSHSSGSSWSSSLDSNGSSSCKSTAIQNGVVSSTTKSDQEEKGSSKSPVSRSSCSFGARDIRYIAKSGQDDKPKKASDSGSLPLMVGGIGRGKPRLVEEPRNPGRGVGASCDRSLSSAQSKNSSESVTCTEKRGERGASMILRGGEPTIKVVVPNHPKSDSDTQVTTPVPPILTEPFYKDYQLVGDSFMVQLAEVALGHQRQKGGHSGVLCKENLTIAGCEEEVTVHGTSMKILLLIGMTDIMQGATLHQLQDHTKSLLKKLENRFVVLITVPAPPSFLRDLNEPKLSVLLAYNNWLLSLKSKKIAVINVDEQLFCDHHYFKRLHKRKVETLSEEGCWTIMDEVISVLG